MPARDLYRLKELGSLGGWEVKVTGKKTAAGDGKEYVTSWTRGHHTHFHDGPHREGECVCAWGKLAQWQENEQQKSGDLVDKNGFPRVLSTRKAFRWFNEDRRYMRSQGIWCL